MIPALLTASVFNNRTHSHLARMEEAMTDPNTEQNRLTANLTLREEITMLMAHDPITPEEKEIVKLFTDLSKKLSRETKNFIVEQLGETG